jgi:integrase
MAKGQILERADSKWLLRVYKGSDPLTGKRVYDNSAVSGTREQAEDELAARVSAKVSRPNPESLFADYTGWWLTIAVNPKLRAKTARDYAAHLRRYALPHLGQQRLNSLRPLDIQGAIGELIAQELSPRTIRYTHSILHSALEQAVKWELIDKNPAAYTVLPRKQSPDILTLTREQAATFAATCQGHARGPIFLLALATGLRPSEYLALRIKDVRFSESKLMVERAVERHKGRWLFRETKRPQSRRTVSLPTEMTRCLEAYCRTHGKLTEPDRLLFEAKGRTPIHERNLVQRVFKPLLKEATLPNIRLYDLRHSFATLSLSAGLPVRWVSEQLGHASIAFTLEVYGHLLCDTRDQAANRLGGILFNREIKKPAETETGRERLRKGAR